ncbi:MAG: hypothetical protein IT208_01000 [Chthonomonadales bacterium]|nr:hypothetical protein [Chthonomonadales bacterium]
MLSSEDLARMRAIIARVLPEEAAILRYDPLAHQWAAVATRPCRVIPKRSVTRNANGMLEGVTLWHVMLPHDTDARAGDRLQTPAGTFGVTGTDAGRTDALSLVAQCSPVDPA